MAQDSPSVASQKYSYEVKRSANSASQGAAAISTKTPTSPPMHDTRRFVPSAMLI